jgi:hypothetical protein
LNTACFIMTVPDHMLQTLLLHFLASKGIQSIPHHPYSPYLAPCNSLFSTLTRGPANCNPPVLRYSSGPSLEFLAKILGVDTQQFLCNTHFYFTVAALWVDKSYWSTVWHVVHNRSVGSTEYCAGNMGSVPSYTSFGGLGSSVSIVSGYGLDSQAIKFRSPAEAKGFFL